MAALQSILSLPDAYKRLTILQRQRFDSLFDYSMSEGRMVVPDSMRPWVEQTFGSVAKVERQPILKVTNTVVFEGALFNKLRADRPMHQGREPDKAELAAMAAKEPFVDVTAKTPEDVFGRIFGRSEVTASNVAKYDALHGLVVFNKADPLAFTEQETLDHFETAMNWITACHKGNKKALHPVIGWNCLWKAGASLVHGHMQVLVGTGEAYAAMRKYKAASDSYKRRYKRGYWDSLFAVHKDLGLGVEKGKGEEKVRVFASVTPKKEKEIVVLADAATKSFFKVIYKVLVALTRKLGVESFNVALLFPPLDSSWKGFPVIAKVVDRGRLDSRTTDIGVAELYLEQSVVSSDPCKVWRVVKKAL